jgi:DivIVA domain-containing protein
VTTVLNPETIRNASFSLMPTGYNPEEVDAALNAVAERIAGDQPLDELVSVTRFAVTDVGYAQGEVDAFFAELAAEPTTPDDAVPTTETAVQPDVQADAPEQIEDAAPEGTDLEDDSMHAPVEEREPEGAEVDAPSEPAADEDVEPEAFTDDDGESDEIDEALFVEAPTPVEWHAPTAGVLDLDVLGGAVDRTAETLGSLRSFIDNEITAMKLAVERQAQETAKRCEQLLHDATAEAHALTESVNTEIARARKAAERQAERERRDLAKELKQARAECEAEIKAARAAADEYAAKVRADADRDRAEAQRTIENAISMQSSIAESLERARQQLTPAAHAGADELAA